MIGMFKHMGWSIMGRAFTEEEFRNSELAEGMSYAEYLKERTRQSKEPLLRMPH